MSTVVETKSGSDAAVLPKSTYQLILKSSPKSGLPTEANFKLHEVALPQLKEGEFLVRNHFLSVDPYIRTLCMNDDDVGKPLHGATVGDVIATTVPDKWPVGTFMSFYFNRTADRGLMDGFGATEYAIGSVNDEKFYRKVDPKLAPLPTSLGILGMPGMTAYFGVRDLLLYPKGGTVVVTSACGAVGTLVGQLVKRGGAGKVIGITSRPEKCTKLRDLFGYDVSISYKTQNIEEELKKACPDGIDAFWDNAGGDIKLQVMNHMKTNSCLVSCGCISQYNKAPSSHEAEDKVIQSKSLVVKTMMVGNTCNEWPQAINELAPLVKSGELRHEETFVDGIENAGNALISLFNGGNIGKMLVRIPHAT